MRRRNLIPLGAARRVTGNLGNDTFAQKPGGKAKIFGDGGNDAVNAVTAGDVVDTGTGLDTLTIKPSLLDRITIVDRDGLVVNGESRRIDAPKGAPTADISYNGDPGPTVFAPTRSQSSTATRRSVSSPPTSRSRTRRTRPQARRRT